MITLRTFQNDKDSLERNFKFYEERVNELNNNKIWQGESQIKIYESAQSFIAETKEKVFEQLKDFENALIKYKRYQELYDDNERLIKKKELVGSSFESEKEWYQKKIDNNNSKMIEIKKEIQNLIELVISKKILTILEIKVPERNTAPITTDGVPSKWFGEDNWYGSGENKRRKNINQCTGYAYGRFNEIAEANGTMILTGNMGNGQDFYEMGKAAGYDTSNNIEDIRTGDTISWAYSGVGHVAIIENIKRDNDGIITSITISEGNMTGVKSSQGAVHYWKHTYEGKNALNELKNRRIRANATSTFVGLVHQTKAKVDK